MKTSLHNNNPSKLAAFGWPAILLFVFTAMVFLAVGFIPATAGGQQQQWPEPDKGQQREIRNAKMGLISQYLKNKYWKREDLTQRYYTAPLAILKNYAADDGSGFAVAYEAMMEFEFAKREYLPDEFSTNDVRKPLQWFLQMKPTSEKGLVMSAELAIIDGDNALARRELKHMLATNPFSLSELLKKDVFDAAEKKEISKGAIAKMDGLIDGSPLMIEKAELAVREIIAMVENKTDVRAEMALMKKLKRNQRLRNSDKILADGFAVLNRKHDAYLVAQAEKDGIDVFDSLSGRIWPEVEAYLTKVGLEGGRQAEKAKAMFDPYRSVRLVGKHCRFASQTSLVLADDAKSKEHFQSEFYHRLTALRNAKDSDQFINILESMIDCPKLDAWETLFVMEQWRPAVFRLLKKPFEQPASFFVLRGKLLDTLGLTGRAAESFKTAIAKYQVSAGSPSQLTEAKKLLENCYEQLLSESPAPAEMVPQKRPAYAYVVPQLPTIAGPVSIRFSKPGNPDKIKAGQCKRAYELLTMKNRNLKTRTFLDAYEQLQELAPLDKPGFADAHDRLATLEPGLARLQKRPVNYETIIKHLTHLISLNPDSHNAFVRRDAAYRTLERPEDVLANLREHYQSHPNAFYRLYEQRDELTDNPENQKLVREALVRMKESVPQLMSSDRSYHRVRDSIYKLIDYSDDPKSVLELIDDMLDFEGYNSQQLHQTLIYSYNTCLSKDVEQQAALGKATIAKRIKVHRDVLEISVSNVEAKFALAKISLENEPLAEKVTAIYDPTLDLRPPGRVVAMMLKDAIAKKNESEIQKWLGKFHYDTLSNTRTILTIGELAIEVEQSSETLVQFQKRFEAVRTRRISNRPLSEVINRRIQRVAGLLAFANQDYTSAVKHLLPLREHFTKDNRLGAALEESRIKTEEQ